ncbi:MAG: T9SS type A sorting domain-containing protein [Chlorobi bacterium]|nr:T9SS type A sorting domain-containing protein [Chlorobiota bacterium]
MKITNKIILLLISVFVVQLSYAQPVLTSNINLSIGNSYRMDGYDYVTNIDPSPSGPNQTWDFANVTGELVITGKPMFCVDPSSTPFADSAAVTTADICAFGSDSISTNYQYFVNSSSSQILTAMGNITQIGNADYGDFIDGIVEYEFPFTYNDSYDYSYEALGVDVNQGYYYMHDSSTVTVEADAYGTITTPVDTYQNTLRMKITQHQYLWTKLEPGDDWLFLGDHIFYEYRWMAPGIKVPVMFVVEYEDTEDYTVHYLVEYDFTTGIEEKTESKIACYPNPVTDRLTIRSDKAVTGIRLFSVNGRQMNEISIRTNPANQYTIDFNRYPKGVYLIELEFEDGSMITKKIIK